MAHRLPGQSVRDEKERLIDDRFIPFYFTTVGLWILFVLEEYRFHIDPTPHPKIFLALAIFATGVTAIVIRRLFRSFRKLNRGERGELAVGEALEDLRSLGYRPIHDIVGKGFNIDHVLVGPAGVFAIETKFRSGYGEISFRNGEGLFVGDRKEEKDCFKQVRSNAKAVSKLIEENCRRYQWVKPLLVFVGNWRVKNEWRDTDLRVLTLNRLRRYFGQQQPTLTRGEIELIASHLERSAHSNNLSLVSSRSRYRLLWTAICRRLGGSAHFQRHSLLELSPKDTTRSLARSPGSRWCCGKETGVGTWRRTALTAIR